MAGWMIMVMMIKKKQLYIIKNSYRMNEERYNLQRNLENTKEKKLHPKK